MMFLKEYSQDEYISNCGKYVTTPQCETMSLWLGAALVMMSLVVGPMIFLIF